MSPQKYGELIHQLREKLSIADSKSMYEMSDATFELESSCERTTRMLAAMEESDRANLVEALSKKFARRVFTLEPAQDGQKITADVLLQTGSGNSQKTYFRVHALQVQPKVIEATSKQVANLEFVVGKQFSGTLNQVNEASAYREATTHAKPMAKAGYILRVLRLLSNSTGFMQGYRSPRRAGRLRRRTCRVNPAYLQLAARQR
jgi:hypothetical protein